VSVRLCEANPDEESRREERLAGPGAGRARSSFRPGTSQLGVALRWGNGLDWRRLFLPLRCSIALPDFDGPGFGRRSSDSGESSGYSGKRCTYREDLFHLHLRDLETWWT
jgi:hypothetical protein